MSKKDKALAPLRNIQEIRERVGGYITAYDPTHVLAKADQELGEDHKEQLTDSESNIFKAMSLYEFKNGLLLTNAVSTHYKSLVVEMSRNLQKEYNCQNDAERALVEIVVLNYTRTLDIQRRINNYLEKGSVTDTGVKFLDVMSKELDRANRHYLAAVEALKNFKHTPVSLKINANTAVVGQNQVVQAVNQDLPTT